jgi:hypothetical protein
VIVLVTFAQRLLSLHVAVIHSYCSDNVFHAFHVIVFMRYCAEKERVESIALNAKADLSWGLVDVGTTTIRTLHHW